MPQAHCLSEIHRQAHWVFRCHVAAGWETGCPSSYDQLHQEVRVPALSPSTHALRLQNLKVHSWYFEYLVFFPRVTKLVPSIYCILLTVKDCSSIVLNRMIPSRFLRGKRIQTCLGPEEVHMANHTWCSYCFRMVIRVTLEVILKQIRLRICNDHNKLFGQCRQPRVLKKSLPCL